MVTSNHVHLLIVDSGERDTIPKSMQLIAGRVGQEYNQRKKRKGAFWEDRYHATAVENGSYLIQGLVYIDLNMVRARVVQHPSEWPFSGYNEIQNPPQRYTLVDRIALMNLVGIEDSDQLSIAHREWVEDILNRGRGVHDGRWSESITVGSKAFIEETKEKLGIKATGRRVVKNQDMYELKEPPASYGDDSDLKSSLLSSENMYFWNACH